MDEFYFSLWICNFGKKLPFYKARMNNFLHCCNAKNDNFWHRFSYWPCKQFVNNMHQYCVLREHFTPMCFCSTILLYSRPEKHSALLKKQNSYCQLSQFLWGTKQGWWKWVGSLDIFPLNSLKKQGFSTLAWLLVFMICSTVVTR